MCASRNPDSVAGQGEFTARVPRSERMFKHGHHPGTHLGNDAAPEFHAETFPPGTAPPERTFQPNPGPQNPEEKTIPQTDASDTIRGATSQDVHKGWGHPGSGMTSSEAHGKHKKERTGLTGLGREGSGMDPMSGRRINEDVLSKDHDASVEGRANASAEERLPVSASELSGERVG